MRSLEYPRLAMLALALAMITGMARAGEKLLPATKAFPFLSEYLSLPAADRDRFAPSYALHAREGRLDGAQAWLVLEDRRIPLPIAPDGQITPPHLADLRDGKVAFSFPPGTSKIGIRVDVVASLPARPDIPTAAVEASLAQANRAMHTGVPFVGPPRMRRAVFEGAEGGELVVGGRRSPLQADQGAPYYETTSPAPGAVLHFKRPPSRILLKADSR